MTAELVLTRAQVRELDRRAIEEYGIPSFALMESAGRACVDEVLALAADSSRAVHVFCGAGNNGGDGLVIARTLFNRGHDVCVHVLGPPAKLESASADVRTNVALWRGLGGTLEHLVSAADVDALAPRLAEASVLVDALFGTGLDRPLRSPADALVHALAASGRPTLAVDLPSGLDADSGEVLGAAVHADVTVSFVARKPGFTRGEGPARCGRVVVAEIGIPRPFLEQARRAQAGSAPS